MRKLSTSPHESAIIEDGGVMDTRLTLHEGRFHVPAHSFALIGMGGEKDEDLIGGTILMGVGVMGLSCNLTPAQMRDIAKQLIAIADLGEANSARMAAAVIAAAGKPRS